MSQFVIDASIAIKWFVPENLSVEARVWRTTIKELHVPALFDAEFANILWKKINRAELPLQDAEDILEALFQIPIQRHHHDVLIAAAFNIANAAQCIVYDSLYLALARELKIPCMTADTRFYNKINSTNLGRLLVQLKNHP